MSGDCGNSQAWTEFDTTFHGAIPCVELRERENVLSQYPTQTKRQTLTTSVCVERERGGALSSTMQESGVKPLMWREGAKLSPAPALSLSPSQSLVVSQRELLSCFFAVLVFFSFLAPNLVAMKSLHAPNSS